VNKQTPIPARERVAKHRAALRAQGLKPKQFWVPDVHSPEFKAEARRAARAIANSPHEAEDQAWIDSISCWDDLPPYDHPLDD
jgi:DNA-binding LacI/PurR family transcriptional regulator